MKTVKAPIPIPELATQTQLGLMVDINATEFLGNLLIAKFHRERLQSGWLQVPHIGYFALRSSLCAAPAG